ncbi:MAG: hypothetical protein AAFU33_24745, partial [Bacteroidota bacterium]
RLKEIPKNKYDEIWEVWKTRDFKNDNSARVRFNSVIRGKVRMYADEAYFFCRMLRCSLEQLNDQNFSFADHLRNSFQSEIEVISDTYGMTG